MYAYEIGWLGGRFVDEGECGIVKFNRNGVVDVSDFYFLNDSRGSLSCASRYEGDVDADGDVDNDDLIIWVDQWLQ